MPKITRSLSSRVDQRGSCEVLLRLYVSRSCQIRLRSGISLPAGRLLPDGSIDKRRLRGPALGDLMEAERALLELEAAVLSYCDGRIRVEHSEVEAIKCRLRGADLRVLSFFEAWDHYTATARLSEGTLRSYRVMARVLARYQAYIQLSRDPSFLLDINTMTPQIISEVEWFYRNECTIYPKYPDIYKRYPVSLDSRRSERPLPRGANVTCTMLSRLRTFLLWALKSGLTDNNPFARFKIGSQVYGDPWFLSLEECDVLESADFSRLPGLSAQRDVFLFHCMVGCRVSDLLALKRSDVQDGVLQYVPQKTSNKRADVVTVPLNARALRQLAKHPDVPAGRLLPFISSQRYNDAIKRMCQLAGLDRLVVVRDALTGRSAKRPLWEVASSHLARRTFVGNLYRHVQDPNLISALSGHTEGSKAFARYRSIDADIKKSLTNLLE